MLNRKRDGCYYCGNKLYTLDLFPGENRATIDHIVPKALGGNSSPDNKIWACFRCNSLKGKMTLEEFLKFVFNLKKLPKKMHPDRDRLVVQIRMLIDYVKANEQKLYRDEYK